MCGWYTLRGWEFSRGCGHRGKDEAHKKDSGLYSEWNWKLSECFEQRSNMSWSLKEYHSGCLMDLMIDSREGKGGCEETH